MDFSDFVRKPFVVEGVQITEENIERLAHLVGRIKTTDDGTPFIQVDRRRVPYVFKVSLGYWITRMEENVRAYNEKAFYDQFVAKTDDMDPWIKYLNNTKPVPAGIAPVLREF